MADLERLRSCGRFEIFSTARHHLGFFKNVACAITYTNQCSETPIRGPVYRALHVVIACHPMLSAIVLDEDKPDLSVHFARLPYIDLSTCVDFVLRKNPFEANSRDIDLEDVLQHQHNLDFKQFLGTRPFWRLVVLHSTEDVSKFTAVWVFHHALGDGTCGPIFHRTFLSALNTTASSNAVHHVVPAPLIPLLPPFEALHPHPISLLFFLRVILASIFPAFFSPRASKLWTGPPISAPDPLPSTKVQILTLSAPTTQKIIQLSRQNKTTVTATLQTALATALFSTLDAAKYNKVLASGPISHRSLLRHEGKPIGEDEFVLALSQYTYKHTRSTQRLTPFPWSEARAVRSAIQTELSKKGKNNVVSLLRYVPSMHAFFTAKVGMDRDLSFEVSSLGAVKTRVGEEGGDWAMGRCVFSQSANVTGPAIQCSIVTGGDGCCVLAFSWLEGWGGEELVGRVVAGVEQQVVDLVGGSNYSV